MKLQRFAVLILVASTFLLAGCAGGTPPAETGKKVEMKDIKFLPAELTISKGTKVTWENLDTVAHTVTSDDAGGPLDSPTLQRGGKFPFTFDAPGTYRYHCEIQGHASKQDGNWTGMVGTITVTA